MAAAIIFLSLSGIAKAKEEEKSADPKQTEIQSIPTPLRILNSVMDHKGQKTFAEANVQAKVIFGVKEPVVSKKYGMSVQLIAAQTGSKIALQQQLTKQII